MHSHFLDPIYVAFFSQTIFTVRQIPQIWRLVTSFLVTGPKFGLLMDPYFLFTYGSGLEQGSPRFTEPGSFFIYNVFVMSVILVSAWPRVPIFIFRSSAVVLLVFMCSFVTLEYLPAQLT